MAAPAEAVSALRAPGRPLDAGVSTYMGSRFGQDFGDVRVHDDALAATAARSVQARAYTVGRDIVFARGAYAPDTSAGRRLIAHELAHVLQQGGSGGTRVSAQLEVGAADDPREIEADRMADAVIGGSTTSVQGLGAITAADGARIQREGGGKEEAPPWTTDELKKVLDACDGGLGIYAKAKKANKDKDPVIVAGDGGWTDMSTGAITIDKTLDKCNAVQQLLQELSNLSRKADFDTLFTSARAGDVAREDFIRTIEKIEYETGVLNDLTAFDKCKDTWGCKTARKEWARKAKNFDDYYKNYLSGEHKEHYGAWWDKVCKAPYEKKHAGK